jgi:hypothetical protein
MWCPAKTLLRAATWLSTRARQADHNASGSEKHTGGPLAPIRAAHRSSRASKLVTLLARSGQWDGKPPSVRDKHTGAYDR